MTAFKFVVRIAEIPIATQIKLIAQTAANSFIMFAAVMMIAMQKGWTMAAMNVSVPHAEQKQLFIGRATSNQLITGLKRMMRKTWTNRLTDWLSFARHIFLLEAQSLLPLQDQFLHCAALAAPM